MDRENNGVGLIPDQLLRSLKKGDGALFLGAGLPLNYNGPPLSRPELAAARAAKVDLPRGPSWPATATAQLGRSPQDRGGLVRIPLERPARATAQPGPPRAAVARRGLQAIVAAWRDEPREEAPRRGLGRRR